MPQLFAILLSVCLGLFLTDALFSLADASLIVFCSRHTLSAASGMLSLLSLVMAAGIYALIGLTPMVPKRLFLPIPLFYLLSTLAMCPIIIYRYGWIQQFAWGISAGQMILGLLILSWSQGGIKFRWPLVSVSQMGIRGFSW